MCLRCHHKSNSLCYYFILVAFIFSVFISIANFAKLKGSLNIRVLQYIYTPSSFTDFLTAKIGSKPKFCIPYISPQYIYDYMKQIHIRKSVGLDDISGHLIRLAGTSLVLPICDILNTSIAAGTFPYLWKSAKVFALHKGGSTSDLNNFRPISVLSIISKILARHVQNCFYTYLNINDLLLNHNLVLKKTTLVLLV